VDMTVEEVVALLTSHPWTFAKTMPEQPHEYTVRRDWDGDLFRAVVGYIQANGVPHRYGRSTYRYLVIGEHKYWTMHGSPYAQILINRAKLTESPLMDQDAPPPPP
jgi:hypothetical protein